MHLLIVQRNFIFLMKTNKYLLLFKTPTLATLATFIIQDYLKLNTYSVSKNLSNIFYCLKNY